MTMTLSLWMLWGVVIILALTVLALARQVGVLHERVAPVGALLSGAGPGVGEAAPRLELQALAGNTVTVGGRLAQGRALLLLFVSHTCPICKKLIPVTQDFTKTERLDVLYAGDADLAEQHRLITQFGIDGRRFVNGPQIGLAFRVDKLPYAVLLDEEGVISAKGLVNSREHLESLIIAKESGFATLQSYLKAQPEAAR
ncbi:MAG TPA: methylamine dehydrogenase accessory protein MauD [Steroidobacteraceae bacterium]|nr:methylamine dehydrogenase accessory protein MauD [Steroidobacteraceae bacterium]